MTRRSRKDLVASLRRSTEEAAGKREEAGLLAETLPHAPRPEHEKPGAFEVIHIPKGGRRNNGKANSTKG